MRLPPRSRRDTGVGGVLTPAPSARLRVVQEVLRAHPELAPLQVGSPVPYQEGGDYWVSPKGGSYSVLVAGVVDAHRASTWGLSYSEAMASVGITFEEQESERRGVGGGGKAELDQQPRVGLADLQAQAEQACASGSRGLTRRNRVNLG